MAGKAERATIRAALKENLGEEIAADMAASIRAALESTKTEWVECPHCHRKNPVVLPNMFERVKAAQLVMSELEGKAGTHREAPAQAKINVANLDDLTDEQLLDLLQGEPSGEVDSSAEEETPE
jgi:hypothetical protein